MTEQAAPTQPAGDSDPDAVRTTVRGAQDPTATVLASARPPAPSALHRPVQIGPYEILDELGSGAMGVVYLARQRDLNRTVALKVLRHPGAAEPEAVQRFLREAQAAARLHHPGIVAIHEVGRDGDQHYYSMDYVIGETADELSRRERLTPRRSLKLILQAATALAYAHAEGVVHRDLKPQNLLVTGDGRVLITDFGLAKDLARESLLTQAGTLLGTPAYMPPEQALGRLDQVDARSDVYSLGAVLYELLAGGPPFAGPAPKVLADAVHTLPEPPRKVRPDVSVDAETICLKCLEKDPARRYASAGALADDIRRFLEGLPIAARPPSLLGRVTRMARARLPFTLVSVAMIVLVCGAIFWNELARAELEAKSARERARVVALHERHRELISEFNASAAEPVATYARRLEGLRVEWDALLAEAPEMVNVRRMRCTLAQALGDLETAGRDFEILMADEPDDPGHLYRMHAFTDLLAEQGLAARYPEWMAAGRRAAAALAAKEDYSFGRASRVRSLLLAGDGDAAWAELAPLLEKQGARTEMLSLQIGAYLAMGLPDPAQALDASDRLLAATPRGAGAYRLRGEVLLAVGRETEAVEAFAICVGLQPRAPEADRARWCAAQDAVRERRGIDVSSPLGRWSADHPDSPSGWAAYAAALREAGRPDEAQVALARALTIAPEDPRVLEEALAAGSGASLADRAVALLARPADPFEEPRRRERAMGRLAAALIEAGHARRAADRLEPLVREHPADAFAAALVGRFRFAHGGDAEAVPLLERAVAARPRDPDAALAFGLALARAGRGEEAAVRLARAAELAPIDPRPAFALGLLHAAAGRPEAAAAFAEAARRSVTRRFGAHWSALTRGEPGPGPLAWRPSAPPADLAARIRACAPEIARRLLEDGARALDAGDRATALTRAEAAAVVQPETPAPWTALARALARGGEDVPALLALRRARERGGAPADAVQADPDLSRFRAELEDR